MNVIDALYHRRAVRDSIDTPVDEKSIRFVIAAAIEAPNAMNRPPWSFVVVRNRITLDRRSEGAKAHCLTSPSKNPHLAGYREHLASPAFNIFYTTPAQIVICATETDAMAEENALTEAIIFASGGVDEDRLSALTKDRAPIDRFDAGTRLASSPDAPALAALLLDPVEEQAGRMAYG